MFDTTKTLGPPETPVKLTPEQAVAALRTLRDQLPLPDGADIPMSSRRRLAHGPAPRFAAMSAGARSRFPAISVSVG